MKKLITLAIILLMSLNASAITLEQELSARQSITVSNHNITIAGISKNRDSIAVCVNNNLQILDKNGEKKILGITIKATRIYETSVKLRIIYSENGEICDESCSNIRCFNNQDNSDDVAPPKNNSQEDQNPIIQNQQIKKSSNLTIMSISLMALAIILLIIFLAKKKR